MPFSFLVGGARSGKSSLAVDLARSSGREVTFIATAAPRDDEMAARIEEHRRRRPSEWSLVETEIDLARVVSQTPTGHFLLVDCLTVWVSNLLEAGWGDSEIRETAIDVARTCQERAEPGAVVSNEVGSGLVPMSAVGRRYRDLLGGVNRDFADHAERAFLMVAGKALGLNHVIG